MTTPTVTDVSSGDTGYAAWGHAVYVDINAINDEVKPWGYKSSTTNLGTGVIGYFGGYKLEPFSENF